MQVLCSLLVSQVRIDIGHALDATAHRSQGTAVKRASSGALALVHCMGALEPGPKVGSQQSAADPGQQASKGPAARSKCLARRSSAFAGQQTPRVYLHQGRKCLARPHRSTTHGRHGLPAVSCINVLQCRRLRQMQCRPGDDKLADVGVAGQ